MVTQAYFQHHNQPEFITTFLNHMNLIFTVLFTIEMVIKIIAFSVKVSTLINFILLQFLAF